jgi:hypothetical protein
MVEEEHLDKQLAYLIKVEVRLIIRVDCLMDIKPLQVNTIIIKEVASTRSSSLPKFTKYLFSSI